MRIHTLSIEIGARFGGRGDNVIINAESAAFRAQLVVPEQQQLYDYWLSRHRASGDLPTRRDISPGHIPKLLPGISLIDVNEDLGRSRIRLAGTRLREIYEREVTGNCIEELEWGTKRNYWLAAYRRTVQEKIPTQGILVGPCVQKDHMVQYWLRLPLFDDSATHVCLVLCFDYFIPASEQIHHLKMASA